MGSCPTSRAVRFALRQLFKSPGFTVIALITLALGIGVNTTAFTVLNRLLLQPLPFPDSSRLVQVRSTSPKWQHLPHSPGDYYDEKEGNTVFEGMAVEARDGANRAELRGVAAAAMAAWPAGNLDGPK